MKSQKNLFILRLINVALFVVLIFIQYSSNFSLKIKVANPMLPLALLVSICMFYSEIRGAVTGLIVGVFVDAYSSTPSGLNAILFMLLGLAAVLIIKHLFNNNVLSAIALCFICSQIYFVFRWLFTFAFYTTFTENISYLLNTAIPSSLYTSILIIPFYYFEKFLFKKFYNTH